MTSCTVREVPEGDRVVLRFHGDFDREGALKLQQRLATLSTPLLLDFTEVHDFDDLAAAMLGRLLVEDRAGRVTLRGLCEHQYRLFHYIGIELDPVTGHAHPRS
jgi:anti-anti-sigma regulatory factor